MSISWGVKQRFKFTANGSLTNWQPPPLSGVYAISYKRSPDNPKAHTILYFGQAGNLSGEAPDLNTQVLHAWADSGHNVGDLYVFVHSMPGSTSGERSSVQEQLIAEYRPLC